MQDLIVWGIIVVALAYLVRRFVRVFRFDDPSCCGCAGACGGKAQPSERGCPPNGQARPSG
jgi:hypothetical protein